MKLLQNYKNIQTFDKAEEMMNWYVNAFNKFAQRFLEKKDYKTARDKMVEDLKDYILKEYIHDVRPSATKGVSKGTSEESLAFLTTVTTGNANEHAYVSDILTKYGMTIEEHNIEKTGGKINISPEPSKFSQIHSDAGKHTAFNVGADDPKLFQNPLDGSTVGSNLLYGSLIVILVKDLVGALITSVLNEDNGVITKFNIAYQGFQEDTTYFGFSGFIVEIRKTIKKDDKETTIILLNKFNNVRMNGIVRQLLVTQFIEKGDDGKYNLIDTIPVAFDSKTLKISLTILINQIIDSVVNQETLEFKGGDNNAEYLVSKSSVLRQNIQDKLIGFENNRNENGGNKGFNGFFNYMSEFIDKSIGCGYYSLPKWFKDEDKSALNKAVMTYWLTKGFGDAGYSIVDLLNQFGNEGGIGPSIGFTGDQQCYVVSAILSNFLEKNPIQSVYIIPKGRKYNIKVRRSSFVELKVEGSKSVPNKVRVFNEGYYADDERNYGFITPKFFNEYLKVLLIPLFKALLTKRSRESFDKNRFYKGLPEHIQTFNAILLELEEPKPSFFNKYIDVITIRKSTVKKLEAEVIKKLKDVKKRIGEGVMTNSIRSISSDIDIIYKELISLCEKLNSTFESEQTGGERIGSKAPDSHTFFNTPVLELKKLYEDVGSKDIYTILPEEKFGPKNFNNSIKEITKKNNYLIDLELAIAANPGDDGEGEGDGAAAGGGGGLFSGLFG